jgi:hypothetical protein
MAAVKNSNNSAPFVPEEQYVFRNNYPPVENQYRRNYIFRNTSQKVENKYRRNNLRANPQARPQSRPQSRRRPETEEERQAERRRWEQQYAQQQEQRRQWTEAAQARRREQNAEYARLHPEIVEHVQEERELTEPERIARNYITVQQTPYADRIAAMVTFLNRYHPYDWEAVFTNPEPNDKTFKKLKRAIIRSFLEIHPDKHMGDPDAYAKYTELSAALRDFHDHKIFGGSRRRTRRHIKNKSRRHHTQHKKRRS